MPPGLHGNVTRAELRAAGYGQAAIAYRCRSGRLFRVHHQVHGIGRAPALPIERAAAAVLACGPQALLSHDWPSAAGTGFPSRPSTCSSAGARWTPRSPAHRLIVELDGWDFHRDRHAFEEDRERHAEALRAGIPTVRITWDRLMHRPGREARRLAETLEARLRA